MDAAKNYEDDASCTTTVVVVGDLRWPDLTAPDHAVTGDSSGFISTGRIQVLQHYRATWDLNVYANASVFMFFGNDEVSKQ